MDCQQFVFRRASSVFTQTFATMHIAKCISALAFGAMAVAAQNSTASNSTELGSPAPKPIYPMRNTTISNNTASGAGGGRANPAAQPSSVTSESPCPSEAATGSASAVYTQYGIIAFGVVGGYLLRTFL